MGQNLSFPLPTSWREIRRTKRRERLRKSATIKAKKAEDLDSALSFIDDYHPLGLTCQLSGSYEDLVYSRNLMTLVPFNYLNWVVIVKFFLLIKEKSRVYWSIFFSATHNFCDAAADALPHQAGIELWDMDIQLHCKEIVWKSKQLRWDFQDCCQDCCRDYH